MNLQIYNGWYNKTVYDPKTGNTVVDTKNTYYYHNVSFNKNYFDTKNDIELLENIRNDLENEILAIDEEINRLKEHSNTGERTKKKNTRKM